MSGAEFGVFTADALDDLVLFFAAHGYATLRGSLTEPALKAAEAELVAAQHDLADTAHDVRRGPVQLDESAAVVDGRPFAHYVYFATKVSPQADALVHTAPLPEIVHRLLGPDAWLLDYEVFGVVYQDARPEVGSGYSRIGWHTDHQSGPHLSIWPGVAFTVHFDPTSPANGFLRVLPGSHLVGTDGIPLGFERVPGEIAVYQERGDVLFHHADLWHSAARGTADGEAAVRRHLRGSWHGGERLDVGHGTDDFVRNARR